MKKLIILIIITASLIAKEEKYAQIFALDTEFKKIEADLRIILDENNNPSERIAMYFSSSYKKFAIYLNKEQRQEMLELYNKYEKWKKVAYENQVSHSKVVGEINKIVSYFHSTEWEKAENVTIKLFAGVGSANALTIIFPKFTSTSNKYLTAEPPAMMFMETSEMDTAMNSDIENLGVTTPKEFFYDYLADTNLLLIKKGMVEKLNKTKNVDSLFD